MPNYKEQSVAGTLWQRAYNVCVTNKLDVTPCITFAEEEVAQIGGNTMTRHVGNLVETFSDPATSFNLINPVDGSTIGTATYQDLYVMLASLYMALAAKRDAA